MRFQKIHIIFCTCNIFLALDAYVCIIFLLIDLLGKIGAGLYPLHKTWCVTQDLCLSKQIPRLISGVGNVKDAFSIDGFLNLI